MYSGEASSTNLTKHQLLCTPTPKNTEVLKGARSGLVPGCDLFSTWLQLSYSRQLDWSLLLQTTLLEADLVHAAHTQ